MRNTKRDVVWLVFLVSKAIVITIYRLVLQRIRDKINLR